MSSHEHHLCEACRQDEYDTFAHDRIHELIAQNDAWLEKYRIKSWPRWNSSLEEATLTFSKDGRAKVVCEIQAAGSVQGDSWEWSWGNANLPESCKHKMRAVEKFGRQKGWSKLTSLFLDSNDYLGWELSSVAVHLLGGTAVYRCPDSETPGYFMYLAILSSQFIG